MTFISSGSQLEIRMMYPTTAAICTAARTLKARYFVTVDGWSDLVGKPVWGVFDMRTAQEDNPLPGAWSINDPIKTFATETADAAVMYALTMMGAG